MKLAIIFILAMGISADAGVLKGISQTIKGAAKDTAVAIKTVSYPVRHPKKSAHGVKKAATSTGKAVSNL